MTATRTSARALALALLLTALAAPDARALSDEEIFRNVPFNLLNPGARALSLGGAFTSLADDSTAVQANPAGLMTLRRPELFLEVRASQLDGSEVLVSGPVRGDFFDGTVSAGAESDPSARLSPAFISYVLPFKRVAFAFSRLESLNVRTRTLNSFELVGQSAIFEEDIFGRPVPVGFEPVDYALTAEADVDAKVVQYNIAMAWKIAPSFSVGVTAVVGTLNMDGRVDNLFVDRTAGPGEPYGEPTLDYATRIDDDDVDLAFNAGFMWRAAEWVSIGGTYRSGLLFELEEEVLSTGVRANTARELYGKRFDLLVPTPDNYALGAAFRPSEAVTILIDVVRVEYSDLVEGYISGLNRITFPEQGNAFTVDDATEVHAGFEYLFLSRTTPVALRIGAWRESDSRIRYDGDDEGFQQIFPGDDDVTHYTAGVGITLKQSIQLDVAADVSSRSSTIVGSTIFRF